MSRIRRSTWNYLSVVAMSVTMLVVGLYATRYLVVFLGEERLGAFRAVSDWGGYLTLFDVALGGALMPLIARALNRRDPEELAGAMASGFHGYRYIALGNLLTGSVLIVVIPWLVPTAPKLVHELRLAALCITAGAVLFVPLTPVRPLWEADQRGYLTNITLIIQSLTITAFSVAFACSGWGITGQGVATLIGLSVYSSILFFKGLSRHPHLIRWFFATPPASSRQQLRALNWPSLVLSVSGRLSLLTDNIVIAFFLGPVLVVPFFLTQRLPQVLQHQLLAIGGSTWAGMVNVHETEGPAAFNARLLELSQLVAVLGISAAIPIIAYNQAFMELWMPRHYLYGGLLLTTLASINANVQALLALWCWMFTGTGRIRLLVPLNIATAIVNITISVGATVLLKHAGPSFFLIGPVLGSTVALILCNGIWFPLLLRKVFQTPLRSLAFAIVRPALVISPICLPALWIARRYPPQHWALLGAEMALEGTVCLGVAWCLALPQYQRQVWIDRVSRAVPRLRRKQPVVEAASAGVTPLERYL